jgi:two-component system sensor histidine kinase EvgS
LADEWCYADFERIEEGELQLAPEVLTVRSFVEGVVEMAGLGAPLRPVELVLHMAPDLPDTVLVDPMRLRCAGWCLRVCFVLTGGIRNRQVFMNLLSNALKFTEQGFVLVNVTRSPSNKRGHINLLVTVRDSGVGIAPDQQGKLFVPFTTIIREESCGPSKHIR